MRRATRPRPITRRTFFPDAVNRIDLRLFRSTAGWHSPFLDRALPRLSRLANKSFLWAFISAALGATGRSGRRAGLRGTFAVLVASAVGHIQAFVVRRKRPEIDVVPVARRLARLPVSPSFPSRHSVSAFAFATGASLEKPAAGIPLLGLAAAVAYSRVYVGVHYPSDVVAGALLGSAVAVATRHFWPVPPEPPARAQPDRLEASERPADDGEGLVVVVNPSAGSPMTNGSGDRLRDALPRAEIIETSDETPLDEALTAAMRARVIGIAGGDGSTNVAAEFAVEAGKPLVVVPSGTLNHFARDLGLESVDDAVDAAKSGPAVRVDVGRIAGRPFLNTASFGSYVDIVDAREKLEERIGKWPALAVAAVRVLLRAQPVPVEIDGRRMDVWMAFFGNGKYEPPGFAPSWRERLSDGLIDVRLVNAEHPFARLRLLLALVTGTLGRSRVYETRVTRGPIRIRSLSEPLRLARDGETFTGPTEFTIEKEPKRLTVFAADGSDR